MSAATTSNSTYMASSPVSTGWTAFDRWFLNVAVFVVVTSIIGLVTTLAGCFHAPQVLLAALLVTGLYAYIVRGRCQSLPSVAPRWRHVLLILLIAMPFRVPAYHYVMGGQDEGLYVNIAHYIQRTGGISVNDGIREALKGTPYVARYDAINHVGNSYVAGVYKDGDAGSRLQFQFYDLFPIWMALFTGIFGSTAGVYALTFLALLSLICFYRLTLLLTNSHRAALIAGGLLALSPLHTFFSKFPVTEIPALCFILLGFLFLAAYCSASQEERRDSWLILSVLAFLCLFMTRISGFMHVPFMIALAWSVLLMDRDAARRARLQFWAASVTIAYFVSVVYGAIWSYHYSHDIYVASFKPIFGRNWKTALGVLTLCAFSVWIGTALWSRKHKLTEQRRLLVSRGVQWLPSVIAYVALCLGLLKIYRLGWTDHYQNKAAYVAWHLVGAGWYGVTATSMWMLLVYMGPLLVLAFLASMSAPSSDWRIQFLRWVVAGFFAYIVSLQWVIPYSPYYARYLLSAVVPSAMLFTVCVWASLRPGWRRTALSIVIILSLAYGAVLSFAQIGKSENAGARAALAHIAAAVGPSDLILLDYSSRSRLNQSEVKTPLMYTFDRMVATVGTADLTDPQYLTTLAKHYDQLFLLTSSRGAPPEGFDFVTSSRFKVMQYEWNHSFPHNLVVGRDYPLRLFRRSPGLAPLGHPIAFATGGVGVAWLQSGWSQPEAWGTWSIGNYAVMSIDPRNFSKFPSGVKLRLSARVLVSTKHPVQRVSVSVDGKTVGSYVSKYPTGEFSMDIPIVAAVIHPRRPVIIAFSLPDAKSPAAIGINRDGRQLAIGLVRAQLLPEEPINAQDAQDTSN